MASTGRLERIAALNDLLTGLAGRQRGEPIEAEQWNAIVEVLQGILGIDVAQETGVAQSLADSFARADHEHLGGVSLAWLDSDLQERVVTGGSGSVSARVALTDITARVSALSGVVSTLSTQLETMQKRNDDSAVDELMRSSKLRGFESRFTGVEDLRALVGSVSAQVQDLGPQVQTVLDLRTQLRTETGEPIDVSKVVAQVTQLGSAVSDATTGVAGETLRMRDLQVAIQELNDVTGIGQGGLDERIATLGVQLQATLDTHLDERFGVQQEEISALIDDKLTSLVDRVTQQVLDQSIDRITETVLAKVTDQVQSIVDERVDDRVKERLGALARSVNILEERVTRLDQQVFG